MEEKNEDGTWPRHTRSRYEIAFSDHLTLYSDLDNLLV